MIVAGGGGDPLIGAIAAIDGLGLTGTIDVVSTDFLPDLDEQLEKGAMSAESGGPLCGSAVCLHDGLQRGQGQLYGIHGWLL